MQPMNKRYPLKFLDAYTREDSSFFFGREEEIGQLYEMVFQSEMIVVYGASGTGKTSLIQCGLASRFGTHEWQPLFIRRGVDLNKSLEKILSDAAGQTESRAGEPEWLDQILDPGRNDQDVTSSVPLMMLQRIYRKNFKPVYLIFDQFEELFILGSHQEQKDFYNNIREILQIRQPLKIIFSIREEYLGYLSDFETVVPQLLRKKIRIEHFTLPKVIEVITRIGKQPDSLIKVETDQETEFSQMVFQKLKIRENQVTIELPYLQVFLDTFYISLTKDESRSAETVFTVAALNKMGDIGDVLRDFVEKQVIVIAARLKLKTETIWSVLSSFVTVEGTKEPLAITEVNNRVEGIDIAGIKEIIRFFESKMILRYSETQNLYEISHDSVAKQIHTHRSEDEITLLRLRSRIRFQCNLPEEEREYSSKLLIDYQPFREKLEPKLNQAEARFILDLSRKVRLQRNRKIFTVTAVIVLIIGALIFGVIYKINKNNEKKQAIQNKMYRDTMEAAEKLIKNDTNYSKAKPLYEQAMQLAGNGNLPSLDEARNGQEYCIKKMKLHAEFIAMKDSADLNWMKKEYFLSLQFLRKAWNTGYDQDSSHFNFYYKKRDATQILKRDLDFFRSQKLPDLTSRALKQINLIDNMKLNNP